MKEIWPFIFIGFILGACSQVFFNQNSSKSGVDEVVSVTQIMKQNMLNDFGFSIQFGVAENERN